MEGKRGREEGREGEREGKGLIPSMCTIFKPIVQMKWVWSSLNCIITGLYAGTNVCICIPSYCNSSLYVHVLTIHN